MSRLDPGTRKPSSWREPEGSEADSGTRRIIPAWAACGQSCGERSARREPVDGANATASDERTDELPGVFTKKTLCAWLAISIRTWDRAAAEGLTPAPDLLVATSPRWLASTIEKWLRTHPKLRGRGRKGGRS
jgi:hypothetical protein